MQRRGHSSVHWARERDARATSSALRRTVSAWRNRGVIAALAAAVLFGASTPIAKLLLGGASPWLLAGLLYLGSGIGLLLLRRLTRSPRVSIAREERVSLGAAIAAGGVIAPVLLMYGLLQMPASGASL